MHACVYEGAGRSSDSRALSCKGLDPPESWIDPAWQKHLQFGLFSVPTSGPQLSIKGCGMCCPVYGTGHIKKSLAAYRKE